MKRLFAILFLLLLAASGQALSADAYELEVSHNDETFIINGEVFKAQLYCFDMQVGDQILFLEGSPLGVCVTAELLNMRTRQSCSVWCE